jgi:hypothetical protein
MVNLILLTIPPTEISRRVVVSTRRLREVIGKAADSGAMLPSPLFALLDNITRKVTALVSLVESPEFVQSSDYSLREHHTSRAKAPMSLR